VDDGKMHLEKGYGQFLRRNKTSSIV
jgi:hypothetical protein